MFDSMAPTVVSGLLSQALVVAVSEFVVGRSRHSGRQPRQNTRPATASVCDCGHVFGFPSEKPTVSFRDPDARVVGNSSSAFSAAMRSSTSVPTES